VGNVARTNLLITTNGNLLMVPIQAAAETQLLFFARKNIEADAKIKFIHATVTLMKYVIQRLAKKQKYDVLEGKMSKGIA